ncbi:MAG: phosphate ABC transporter permease PstA [Planctomycetota bacterium]
MSTTESKGGAPTAVAEDPRKPGRASRPAVPRRRTTSLSAHGEPMVWLTGGSLAIGLLMVVGLLWIVLSRGLSTFWPGEVVRFSTNDGTTWVGLVNASETRTLDEDGLAEIASRYGDEAAAAVRANGGVTERRNVRSLNLGDTAKTRTDWIDDFALVAPGESIDGAWARAISTPEWEVEIERFKQGRWFGTFEGFRDGDEVYQDPARAWDAMNAVLAELGSKRSEHNEIVEHEIGRQARRMDDARLDAVGVRLEEGEDSPEYRAAAAHADEVAAEVARRTSELQDEAQAIEDAGRTAQLLVRNAAGTAEEIDAWDVVRAVPSNRQGFFGALGTYFGRWNEYLRADPRKANTEGGVYPAIFGTVAITLLMCFAVVPFGVLAALYLREYAKQGVLVSIVRVAVNNLAGVPSIVFGVFGLAFFCYTIGVEIDDLFYPELENKAKFGTGGILWASFTLALLTLPVVIVATEEALSAVPGSMREGSYACGATKWQTISRIVLPRALPGIMTGMILAIARGAGEVAPLMLVGAMKLAPSLPVDGEFPYLHPERSFMHLGFHIYDLAFQSPDSEAAIPMVYTTTFLLIVIVVTLNLSGIWVRSRLRRRFSEGAV